MLLDCVRSYRLTNILSLNPLRYSDRVSNGNGLTEAYGLVALNLLLPLAVTVLRGMIASLNPLSKYSVLKGNVLYATYVVYVSFVRIYNECIFLCIREWMVSCVCFEEETSCLSLLFLFFYDYSYQ
jgi:hypothetical protein